jgi:outer membrane protein OmpA-like peptidoglycan-associated protein
MATNREGSFFINEEHCCHDLYEVSFKKEEKIVLPEEPEPEVDTTINMLVLKGIVMDMKTKRPLESKLELVNNEDGMLIEEINTNADQGKYLVMLPSGGDYAIAVSSPGYLFHSENFIIAAAEGFKQVEKDILLKRIEVGSSIVLKNIFFDFDKSTLREVSYTELNRLLELLVKSPNLKIEISGHTDNKGSRGYNKRLSLSRAKSVVNYLIDKGIDKNRLEFKGFGFDKPIASNDTDDGRQLNRRTEFTIIGK